MTDFFGGELFLLKPDQNRCILPPMPPPSSLPLATAPVLPAARRRRFPFAALGLAAALAIFGWGILHLFELRFSGGDVYPRLLHAAQRPPRRGGVSTMPSPPCPA